MARTQVYNSQAEKQKAYRERKRNALEKKRNTEHQQFVMLKMYFTAILAIRELYALCDEKQPNANQLSSHANFLIQMIGRAAFDAQSDSVFRRRAAGGLKNSSSPLDPEFDKQFTR